MTVIDEDCLSWAANTFREVDLGDSRLNRRFLSIAGALAQSPTGCVMAAMRTPAEREGAFRFLANERFDVGDLGDGITRSTLMSCTGLTYCPVDGASISLSDDARSRDIGGVGCWNKGGRGLHAITMIAADRYGAPVGIFGPQWWARTQRSNFGEKGGRQHSKKTEMKHVLVALKRVEQARRETGSHAQLWFQLDRGFDSWVVFQLAQQNHLLITARSTSDRRIETPQGRTMLYPTLKASPWLGEYKVAVRERPGRAARTATLSVRVARVQLLLQTGRKRTEIIAVSAVSAREENYCGEDRLDWVLLTTAHVSNLAGARAVILGYTTRWLIEDLHRACKRGWTNVETTQLRRRNSICKWATLHLAVAARALRLSRLARTDPDQPSDTEFSRDELDAILLLMRKDTRHRVGDTPRLADVVLLLAQIGGHDRYSKKPAGATVVGRGLERISSLAEGLAVIRAEK